jgi:uncharacterized membrane protein
MILMAGLVKLPLAVIGIVGLAIICGHNLADPYVGDLSKAADENAFGWLLKILYLAFFAKPVQLGPDGPRLVVLYSIIPWIGVMATGYAFGSILLLQPTRRNWICLLIGIGSIVLFLSLRSINLYGDPRPWSTPSQATDGRPAMPAWLSFLNTNKYPASLDFLLMTLGPVIALIPLLELARGVVAEWVSVFGRVPFFFYVLHIPLIHALALVVSLIRFGEVNPWLFTNHPMGNPRPPDGYAWSLPLLYLVWAVTILILYFPCRWFAGVKARRTDWWLSYL